MLVCVLVNIFVRLSAGHCCGANKKAEAKLSACKYIYIFFNIHTYLYMYVCRCMYVCM